MSLRENPQHLSYNSALISRAKEPRKNMSPRVVHLTTDTAVENPSAFGTSLWKGGKVRLSIWEYLWT